MSTQGEIRRNQIDRYVNNQMKGEERMQFEQRMRDHAELAENVHMHRDVQTGIEYYFMKELKQKLIKSDAEKPKHRIRVYLAIAASILVLAGVGVTYYLLNDGRMDNNNLFMNYFEPYPNVIAPISRSSENSPRTEAMQLYEMEQYAEAILKLDTLIQENPERLGLVFYRGVSYLGTDQPEKAVADFKAVIAANEETFVEPAYWYLGLSQLEMGKKQEAKKSFLKIKATGGALADQAEQILETI